MELAKELTALAGHRGPIHDLLVSRDGKRLLSASEDSTVLVWDVGSLPPLPPSEEIHLEAHDLEALGKDLESADAARAFKAIVRLAKAPSQSIPWLDARLKATTFDPARVADLFKQLDSDDFATRKNAEEQLASLGDKIEQLLRKAAENNPSVDVRRAAERLLDGLKNRNVPSARLAEFRAVELLERIGSSEARMLLERLSKGDDETRLTVEAKGALHRLGKDVPRP
jgi:HEAT repeat protein